MRRIAFAASLTLVLAAAACGSSPSSLCSDGLQATCQKLFDCTPSAQQDACFKEMYGTSVSDCVTKQDQGYTVTQANCGFDATIPGAECAKMTTANACDNGDPNNTKTVYHADKAQECIDSVKAATCSDLNNTSYTPAGCDQVCQAS